MEQLKEFWREEDGISTIEIILILAIFILIIVIFREQIVAIISSAFEQINSGAEKINSDISIKKK